MTPLSPFTIPCVYFPCISHPFLYIDFFNRLLEVLEVLVPSLQFILGGNFSLTIPPWPTSLGLPFLPDNSSYAFFLLSTLIKPFAVLQFSPSGSHSDRTLDLVFPTAFTNPLMLPLTLLLPPIILLSSWMLTSVDSTPLSSTRVTCSTLVRRISKA